MFIRWLWSINTAHTPIQEKLMKFKMQFRSILHHRNPYDAMEQDKNDRE